jgi:hypothetical protein
VRAPVRGTGVVPAAAAGSNARAIVDTPILSVGGHPVDVRGVAQRIVACRAAQAKPKRPRPAGVVRFSAP